MLNYNYQHASLMLFTVEIDNSKFEFHLHGVHNCPAYVVS